MTPTTFSGLIQLFLSLINYLILLLLAVVSLYVVWKMIDTWILNAGDEGKRAEGNTVALSAVLIAVLAISVWGIVTIIRESFLNI
jgi:small-conductance mechanosensitive channel